MATQQDATQPGELELVNPSYRVGTNTHVLDSDGNLVGLASIQGVQIEQVDDTHLEVTIKMNLDKYPPNTIHL